MNFQRATYSFHLTLLLLLSFSVDQHVIAQDSLTIQGITIHPGDSLEARELLRNAVPPTSEFWITEHNKPGIYSATNTFGDIAEIAFPLDPNNINESYVDSLLEFLNRVYTQHSNKDVQAEFLYAALRLSSRTGRYNLETRYYSILSSEYGDGIYATRAQRFAPNRAIKVGNKIPSFELPSMNDSTLVYSDDNLIGTYYLIDFWGTWCTPCIFEMPYLQQAYNSHNDTGFTILSIAVHDSYDSIQNFRANEWPMPWDHVYIENDSPLEDKIVSDFEVYGFPKTILVDDEGTIIATEINLRKERLIATLNQLLE